MKILGIEIGEVKPRIELPSPSPCPPPHNTGLPVATERAVEHFINEILQDRVDHLKRVLNATVALSEKWERHLTQSQTEKYQYVALYEASKKELEAALRISAFREAQIASLKTRVAALEEPKLPRMVSHKPAATK